MRKFLVFSLIALALAPCSWAQKNREANKIALEASESAKNHDWDAAIEGFRKATAMDHKYAANLSAALQQRGTAAANERRFTEAMADFDEAVKATPEDAGAHERRAAVAMKMNDFDKALADYSAAIKSNPHEVRYLLYRSYILELKGDSKSSMADTEKVLKMQKDNPEAQARKTRLEARMKTENPPPQTQAAPGSPPKPE